MEIACLSPSGLCPMIPWKASEQEIGDITLCMGATSSIASVGQIPSDYDHSLSPAVSLRGPQADVMLVRDKSSKDYLQARNDKIPLLALEGVDWRERVGIRSETNLARVLPRLMEHEGRKWENILDQPRQVSGEYALRRSLTEYMKCQTSF